jgi:hypothetical protein
MRNEFVVRRKRGDGEATPPSDDDPLTEAVREYVSPPAEPTILKVPKRKPTPPPRPSPTPIVTSDKKRGDVTWREMLQGVSASQFIKRRASWSQDYATISVDTDRPICVLCLSDTHLGSWATDYDLFAKITQEILDIPELFVILLGDLVNMAIKLRNVAEIHDDGLTPGEQFDVLEGWLSEIQHKILAATWDNHAAEREEQVTGTSTYARMLSRRVVYHAGIGHVDITVGSETYKLAISHHFQGRSIYNPCHGAQRYLVMQAHDREIAACGDSHVPGMLAFTHGATTKLAINAGTIQTQSAYAKRYFSLTSLPIFPCFTLDPHAHCVTPYWNVESWLRSSGLDNQ